MEESINTALTLLGVGMITVFIVLLCVVILGNILINLVNKYIPAPIEVKAVKRNSNVINNATVAAITAAVEIFTKGKGKITNITRRARTN